MEINDTRIGDILLSWKNILTVVLEKDRGNGVLLGYINEDGTVITSWMPKLRAVHFRKNFSLVVKANDGNYCG